MIVGLFAFLINFCYAGYIKSVQKGSRWKAVLFGEAVTIMAMYNVREFVRDPSAIFYIITCGAIGTVLSMKYNK